MHCISPVHQHLGAVFKKRFFSAPFPWLMGRAASPHPLFLRARDTGICTEQCGPRAPWLGWRLCPGLWGRDSPRKRAQSRGDRLLSVGVSSTAAAAHPEADSLVMLAYSSVLLHRGWAGTWENGHCPGHTRVREVTKSQHSRGTCPGAVLAEANTSLVQSGPTPYSPLASSPLARPLHSGVAETPFKRSFSGLPAGVVTNCPTSKPAHLPPQCQEWCHQLDVG